jgi:hypothetical protein
VKKAKALSITFSIASIVLISWTILLVAAQTGVFIKPPTSWPTDSPALIDVTKSENRYKLSFAFTSANYKRELQNIVINPREETVNGITGYINGTAVTGANPVFKYTLQSGDNLHVDVLLPCANFSSGATIEVIVFGCGFMAGGTVLLP